MPEPDHPIGDPCQYCGRTIMVSQLAVGYPYGWMHKDCASRDKTLMDTLGIDVLSERARISEAKA